LDKNKVQTLSENKVILTCQKCVLSTNMEGVSLDENGICNHCRAAVSDDRLQELRVQAEKQFEELAGKIKGQGSYDVVVGWSGGKDSTYTVAMLKQKYGLRVLGFSFDNGFVSPAAMKNLFTVSETLDVDLMVVKPPFSLMKQIFRESVERHDDLYPAKALHRASIICNSCMGIAKFIALRIAIEKKIPMMAFGWTPGQATVLGAVFRIPAGTIRKTQEASARPLRTLVGDAIRPYFLEEEHFADPALFPWNISPLAWLDYDEENIIEYIKQFGWTRPQDTDPNSTNCLINTFANVIHLKNLGYNPYAMELAEMVRRGKLDREEALQRLATREKPEVMRKVTERLEMNGY
jgi:hypothetical protein